jgi:hypothetical protein
LVDGREPRELILQLPRGSTGHWTCEVLFDGHGLMFLYHGWAEFARAHILAVGDFVSFMYDGEGVFFVRVYDADMVLRQYNDEDSD